MRFAYDKTVDALAIYLVDDPKSARTQALDARTNLDFDEAGRLVMIEILDASAIYPADSLARMESAGELLTLAEAAKESGLGRDTLRQLVHQGRLPAEKRGRDWAVRRSDLYTYLESRKPVGRPAKRRKARRPRPTRSRTPAGMPRT